MTDNQTSLLEISPDDQVYLGRVLDHCDHPVYVDDSEVSDFFDRFKLVFWKPITVGPDLCSFCQNPASYNNKPVEMTACETCMYDIENGEIDVFNPEDHPVSRKIRTILCDWADREHWSCTSAEELFGEFEVTFNICYVCKKTIECQPNVEVAIATGSCAIAHYECASEHGFRDYFGEEDYNGIFTGRLEVDDMIADLDGTPYYMPEMSQEDSDQLEKILEVADLPNHVNYDEIRNIFDFLHAKYWQPTEEQRGCSFCQYPCTLHNDSLNLLSCYKCIQYIYTGSINVINPNNTVDRYLRTFIDKWANQVWFHQTRFRELGLTYNTCQICKHDIDSNDEVAVTHVVIAHLHCFRAKGSTPSISKIVLSESFGLDAMISALKLTSS